MGPGLEWCTVEEAACARDLLKNPTDELGGEWLHSCRPNIRHGTLCKEDIPKHEDWAGRGYSRPQPKLRTAYGLIGRDIHGVTSSGLDFLPVAFLDDEGNEVPERACGQARWKCGPETAPAKFKEGYCQRCPQPEDLVMRRYRKRIDSRHEQEHERRGHVMRHMTRDLEPDSGDEFGEEAVSEK